MLSDKMQKALNDQINAEMFSSYLYLSMAAYFAEQNLDGFAQWMHVQAAEENAHAMKIFRFIEQRRGRVELRAIDEPQTEWDSPLAAFEAAFEHEQKVTAMINDLVALACEEKDNASCNMLQWFVDEQVEEEASADDIVQKLRMIGDKPQGLMMLNQVLGQRRAGGEE